MHILFLSPSGQLGGAEICLLDMLAGLRAACPDWKLSLVSAEQGPLSSSASTLGVETTMLPFSASLAQLGDSSAARAGAGALHTMALARKLTASSFTAAAYRQRLRSVIQRLAPDVIHSNGLKSDLLGAWATRHRTPLIWHIHDYLTERPLIARLLRWSAAACDLALANSDSVARDVRSCCGARLPIRTLYNSVDLDVFSPFGRQLDLDRLAGLPLAPEGTLRVGMLATMAWWKGHREFLQALARLPLDLPVRGYVIGGPLYQTAGSQLALEQLRTFATELRLGDRVGFTGFVHDVAPAIRSLDVVAHASTTPEPFGRVIMEAMACARPVVTTALGGAAELVQQGRNALSCRPSDPADLAQQILRLLRDPQLRRQIGLNGRRTVEARFDRRRLAQSLVPIYQELKAGTC